MEQRLKVTSPDVIMGPLLALLDDAQAVPLVISVSSMTPFLVHGRDTVYLSKVSGPIKKGDMVLYQRSSGRYILHRVLKAEASSYTMIGDAQTLPEPGITDHQIRAVVTAVRRKGKLLQKGSFWWDFFEHTWIRIVPIRPIITNAYAFMKRLAGSKGAI